jgi:hypothetical protein
VLALTDGVYAIITLLVLDIHVPELSAHQTLRSAISEVRPSFISFTIAFIELGDGWRQPVRNTLLRPIPAGPTIKAGRITYRTLSPSLVPGGLTGISAPAGDETNI